MLVRKIQFLNSIVWLEKKCGEAAMQAKDLPLMDGFGLRTHLEPVLGNSHTHHSQNGSCTDLTYTRTRQHTQNFNSLPELFVLSSLSLKDSFVIAFTVKFSIKKGQNFNQSIKNMKSN
jgi:hypothetical protein